MNDQDPTGHYGEDTPICPWCDHKADPTDFLENCRHNCTECGREYAVTVEYEVTYSSIPVTEVVGEFTTFVQWVNKAASWIGGTGARCWDARGRECLTGKDFMRARDEGAFPVRYSNVEAEAKKA